MPRPTSTTTGCFLWAIDSDTIRSRRAPRRGRHGFSRRVHPNKFRVLKRVPARRRRRFWSDLQPAWAGPEHSTHVARAEARAPRPRSQVSPPPTRSRKERPAYSTRLPRGESSARVAVSPRSFVGIHHPLQSPPPPGRRSRDHPRGNATPPRTLTGEPASACASATAPGPDAHHPLNITGTRPTAAS